MEILSGLWKKGWSKIGSKVLLKRRFGYALLLIAWGHLGALSAKRYKQEADRHGG